MAGPAGPPHLLQAPLQVACIVLLLGGGSGCCKRDRHPSVLLHRPRPVVSNLRIVYSSTWQCQGVVCEGTYLHETANFLLTWLVQ